MQESLKRPAMEEEAALGVKRVAYEEGSEPAAAAPDAQPVVTAATADGAVDGSVAGATAAPIPSTATAAAGVSIPTAATLTLRSLIATKVRDALPRGAMPHQCAHARACPTRARSGPMLAGP